MGAKVFKSKRWTYYLELGIFNVYINDSFICKVKENKFCSPTKKKAIEMKLM